MSPSWKGGEPSEPRGQMSYLREGRESQEQKLRCCVLGSPRSDRGGRAAIYSAKDSREVKDKGDSHIGPWRDCLRAVWLECNYCEAGAISVAPFTAQ